MKIIRFLMYVGGFFGLFFLLTALLWGIFLNLPPIPGCGGFACLDIGFAVVIGSLIISVSVSFSVILGLYWRWEVQGKWLQKKGIVISPTFIHAEDGLDVFSTQAKAETFMEAIDVKNGVYRAAYDRLGDLLNIEVTSDDFVVLNSTHPPINKAEELHNLLRSFLKMLKERNKLHDVSDSWLENASLDEMVAKAMEFKSG